MRTIIITSLIFVTIFTSNSYSQNDVYGDNPLEILSPLLGTWEGCYKQPNGQILINRRKYNWDFNNSLLVGKNFLLTEEGQKQTRHTIFSYVKNEDRIVFWDFDNLGGYGYGTIESTPEGLYFDSSVRGSNHVDWRGVLIFEGNNKFLFKVEIPKDSTWIDAGIFEFIKLND